MLDWLKSKKEGIFYSLFFFILFIFQTKTLNTGDAGELVSASFGLGIAHPSGYPIYIMISKLFTFLPFGNIPMKVALVSSFSTTFIVILLNRFFKKEGFPFFVTVLAGFMILSSYSFFGQSLIAKFYPLNTLLIFVIFYLGYNALYSYDSRIQLTIAFLFGLAAGLHQTTFLMLIPLVLVVILHFRSFLKHLPVSVVLLILGFCVVFYLMVRSWKPVLLNMSPSGNLHQLIYTLLRKAYGTGSSPHVAESLIFIDPHRVIHALKNTFLLIKKEFYTYSFFLFFIGLFGLFKTGKRKLVYIVAAFIMYSVVLAYLTFSSPKPTLDSWYIVANQYYLPAFLFYVVICSFGVYVIYRVLPSRLSSIAYLSLAFPLVYFPQNLFVNFYDKNHVAYYKAIDQLFSKPIKSIVVFSGDNDVFQGWYEKNVEKFRDDICMLSAPTISEKIWGVHNGCMWVIYKKSFPEFFKNANVVNLASVKDYIRTKHLYSTSPIEANALFRKYLFSEYAALDFLDLLLSQRKDLKKINEWLAKYRKGFEQFAHYRACLTHSTDDLFTKTICMKYSNYLTFLAYDIGNKTGKGKISHVNLNFDNKSYSLDIYTNSKNVKYLYDAYRIVKYNEIEDFYLFKGF